MNKNKATSKFKILRSPCFHGTGAIEKEINGMMAKGWELAGHLFYTVEGGAAFYLQPMVKHSKGKSK